MNSHKITGNLVDIENQVIYPAEISISNGFIVSIKKINQKLNGYILPGLIDSHVHIESSMLTPARFAEIAIPKGVIAAVCDPHEIANVCGIEGINFMIDNAKTVPFKFFFGAPSCVPACDYDNSGYIIDSKQIKKLLNNDDIWLLSEMMNFPGVIYNVQEIIHKLLMAKHFNKPIDGHAPGLIGDSLTKYISEGISTDHECISYDEAKEKISKGMKILIREGSAAKNFENLYKLIDEFPDKVMLCTDDSHPDDLLHGYINKLIVRGLEHDINIFNLLKAACINPVKHYKLPVCLLREGDSADFIVIDSFDKFNILQAYIAGNLIFENDKNLFSVSNIKNINNFKAAHISLNCINVPVVYKYANVIELIDGEIYTKPLVFRHNQAINSTFKIDTKNDILKLVYVNRYQHLKPSAVFIKGFNIKHGAIAQTISHDSHNILAVGSSDDFIVSAVNKLIDMKGGIVFFNGEEFYTLQLEIGGLMSNSSGKDVAEKYQELNKLVKKCGCSLTSPFMALSFLSLLVVPELKIGPKGLFSFSKFNYIDLFTDTFK